EVHCHIITSELSATTDALLFFFVLAVHHLLKLVILVGVFVDFAPHILYGFAEFGFILFKNISLKNVIFCIRTTTATSSFKSVFYITLAVNHIKFITILLPICIDE